MKKNQFCITKKKADKIYFKNSQLTKTYLLRVTIIMHFRKLNIDNNKKQLLQNNIL